MGASLTDYLGKQLKMVQLTGEPYLYVKQLDGKTVGILGSYVDDCLFVGE